MSESKLSLSFRDAMPFWLSLTTLPVLGISAFMGSWWLLATHFYVWLVMSILDLYVGGYKENADTETPEESLFWYRLITQIWLPIQFVVTYGAIYFVSNVTNYSIAEKIGLMISVGILSGSIGIVYAHELMHQKSKLERFLGDGLLALVLYSHFRSEHLLVHHIHVATPKDSATARYNQGFHRFFPSVLIGSFVSALEVEKQMLARKKLPATHKSNPFWKYLTMQLACLLFAFWIGGWAGIGFFAIQAIFAIFQLELVNYIEHYGLTRELQENGKYEHVKPRHSWNSSHKVTNFFMINLQRHSDHHYKPSRRYPLLQTYSSDEAPQLKYGYPILGLMALVPPIWRRHMNPKVRAWRKQFYPHIEDWQPYNKGLQPK